MGTIQRGGRRVRKTNEGRFWEHAVRSDGCWLWEGHVQKTTGYGTSNWENDDGKLVFITAHCLSYRLFKGEIPKGKLVRHTCDIRHCVNPEHLIIGTYKNNMEDCVERGRIANGEAQGLSVMTEEKVRELRVRVAAGEKQMYLAPEYGICQATVSQIIRRVTWRHVA